jgi:ribosome-associated protein
MTEDEDWQELPPSKSARKREAHALQKLGEELVALRAADLARLPLPESLREAIDEARRLTSRGALARQRQYIGKLMRDIDVQPILDAMGALTEERNARARMRR